MVEHGMKGDCFQVFQRIVERGETCDAVRAREDVRRIDEMLRGCPFFCSSEYVFRCTQLDKELRDRHSEGIRRFEAFLYLLPGVSGSFFNCGAVRALRRDRAAIVADILIKHELMRFLEERVEI